MKIYDFRDSVKNADELKHLIIDFYEITSFLYDSYPEYDNWFLKHIVGCFKNQRTILYTKDNDKISGLIFLKKDLEETKICTLYVLPEYRDKDIASKLIDASFEYLGTSKPLATINSSKLNMFSKIIDKYGWEISEEKGVNKEKELILNGKKYVHNN